MRRIMLLLLCILILTVGGISVYVYYESQNNEYDGSGMFVDRGESYEYATMYNLSKSI